MISRMSHAGKFDRIVSLAPSVTSILFALGQQSRLVGVTKWCADVAPVGNLPQLGDCWSVRPEELKPLEPDCVIGSVPFKPEVVAAIVGKGFRFLALHPTNLTDVYSDILLLGRLLDAKRQARVVVGQMHSEIAAVRRLARGARTRPKVYCESWSNPLIVSPRWVEELVKAVGGRFVPKPGGRRVTDEEVIAANPEVIILAWCATGDRAPTEQIYQRSGWGKITAVSERRVFVVRDEKLNTPSPILLEGLRELARLIHPEVFAEANLAQLRESLKASRENKRKNLDGSGKPVSLPRM